jgi:hypothetical protein
MVISLRVTSFGTIFCRCSRFVSFDSSSNWRYSGVFVRRTKVLELCDDGLENGRGRGFGGVARRLTENGTGILRYGFVDSSYGVRLRTSTKHHIHMRVTPISCI